MLEGFRVQVVGVAGQHGDFKGGGVAMFDGHLLEGAGHADTGFEGLEHAESADPDAIIGLDAMLVNKKVPVFDGEVGASQVGEQSEQQSKSVSFGYGVDYPLLPPAWSNTGGLDVFLRKPTCRRPTSISA